MSQNDVPDNDAPPAAPMGSSPDSSFSTYDGTDSYYDSTAASIYEVPSLRDASSSGASYTSLDAPAPLDSTDMRGNDSPPREQTYAGGDGVYGAYAMQYPAAYAGAANYPGYQPTSGLAIASMISGIAGFVMFPVIGSILAVVFGHVARREILQTGRPGNGMALAGLILGYIGIGFLVAIIALVVLGSIASATWTSS